ncbi:hypothetical protein [Armatimonas sp.]|uniref:hypothetical protein n=1 Tax=Armatimonas sp. TaxID=1872638 RepID=UPI00286A71EF|nr:hypothetical protein [Armatimonas sp.]
MKTEPVEQREPVQRATRRPELVEAGAIFGELADALDELYVSAAKRRAQPDYYWDRAARCNVGDHLARAASLMEGYLSQIPDGSPAAFLPAALHALDSSRTRYLETYDDPDAFGIGVHNDVIRIALAACSQHGVPPPAVEDTLPMSDFDQ